MCCLCCYRWSGTVCFLWHLETSQRKSQVFSFKRVICMSEWALLWLFSNMSMVWQSKCWLRHACQCLSIVGGARGDCGGVSLCVQWKEPDQSMYEWRISCPHRPHYCQLPENQTQRLSLQVLTAVFSGLCKHNRSEVTEMTVAHSWEHFIHPFPISYVHTNLMHEHWLFISNNREIPDRPVQFCFTSVD